MNGRGYFGEVTLVSPTGDERVRIVIPGRFLEGPYNYSRVPTEYKANQEGYWLKTSSCLGGIVKSEAAKRRDRKFRRLLSAGWTVVRPGEETKQKEEKEKKEEKKKQRTEEDEVAKQAENKPAEKPQKPASKGQKPEKKGASSGKKPEEGKQKGQKKASGKRPQPNQKAPSSSKPRGNRGGSGRVQKLQKQKDKLEKLYRPASRLISQHVSKIGGGGIYCPQPPVTTREILKSAEQSAVLMAELVGRSAQKIQLGVTVDVDGLLIALEIGDNPLPFLEVPRKRPRLKLLLTPDRSGSTQDWSGLACAWAIHLSNLPDVDVVLVDNFNGEFHGVSLQQTDELLANADIVVYLGDGDGYELCGTYAQKGATILALDNYCARDANPRLKEVRTTSTGKFYWIDRVSADDPSTWYNGLRLVLAN